MSYGGSKNPPWQRNNIAGQQQIPSLLQNSNLFQPAANPQVFNQIQAISQPQPPPPPNISMIASQMSGALTNQIFTQSFSYPTRSLNPIAFQQNPPIINQQQQQQSLITSQLTQSPNQQSPNHRVFNGKGLVTKVQKDIGFIDEEIFFHKAICKGSIMPKVGDRVIVEASYNQNMPFKWTATLVQFSQNAMSNSGGSNQVNSGRSMNPIGVKSYNHNSENNYRNRVHNRSLSPRKSPERRRDSRSDLQLENERKRRREEREKERHREKRDNSPELPSRRERSPIRRSSPAKKRRTRVVPRYMVQIPKMSLALTSGDVMELKTRYNNLYVPSDFFYSKIRWGESFPPDSPFMLKQSCAFHVLHKELETGKEEPSVEANDADYLFSARVMLMGIPPTSEIYQKCFATAEELVQEEEKNLVHPSRLISFLVGIRGKNETMAIGGPWSKTLDGENPESDPTVLIKTAIRTCKSLTGIDLFKCTQWYRFMELYYHRPETTHKGEVVPARVETVVVFLPDIRSCVPTRSEWDELHKEYQLALERILNNDNDNPNRDSSNSQTKPGDATAAGAERKIAEAENETMVVEIEEQQGEKGKAENEPAQEEADKANEKTTDEKLPDNDDKGSEPVKVSTDDEKKELNPKAMTVQQLTKELNARNLPVKGPRAHLVARLTKALKSSVDTPVVEETVKQTPEEPNQDEPMEEGEPDFSDLIVIDEVCDPLKQSGKESEKGSPKITKKLDEKDKKTLQKRYTLPENPHIIVHPSKTAKSGKFDCTMMSLSVLLDYRPEDSKEHSFEVSLFAELFNEMVMRDCGFNIYKALALLPEPKKEETKKKDSDKEASGDKKGDENKKDNKDEDKSKIESEDDTSSTRSNERKRKDKEAQKSFTFDPDLLLSFAYFDQSHCGYVLTKDVEDLFNSLGLALSRAQIKKVIKKMVSSDSLYYRKLTDKVKDDNENLENVSRPVESDATAAEIAKIAKGNTQQLSVFGPSPQLNGQPAESSSKTTESEMVMHNGVLLNVAKLVEQMKRSERDLASQEQLLIELRKQNAELTTTNSKSQSKIKDLSSELKSTSRKLSDVESSLSSLQRKSSDYQSVLTNIYEKVGSVLPKKEKEREKDRGDSRSKDQKDKDSKDKDSKDSKDKESKDSKESKPSDSKRPAEEVKPEIKQEN